MIVETTAKLFSKRKAAHDFFFNTTNGIITGLKVVNLRIVFHSIQINNSLPPVHQMTVEYELEPWGERNIIFLEGALEIGEASKRNVFDAHHFVGIRFKVNIFLEKKDVIDFVLAPLCVGGRSVQNSCEEIEII